MVVEERWFALSVRERLALLVATPVVLLALPLLNRANPYEWGTLLPLVAGASVVLFARSARVGVVLTTDAVVRSDAFVTRGIAWVDVVGIRVLKEGASRRTVFVATSDGEFVIAHSGMRRAKTELDAFLVRAHELWRARDSDRNDTAPVRWKPTYDRHGDVVLRSRLGAKVALGAPFFGAVVGTSLGTADLLQQLAVVTMTMLVVLAAWHSRSVVRLTPSMVEIRKLGYRTVILREDIVDVVRAPAWAPGIKSLAIVDRRRNLTLTLPAPLSILTFMPGEDPQLGLIHEWLRDELLTPSSHGER